LPPKDTSKRLIIKKKAIRVLLDTGSSGKWGPPFLRKMI
jgi:hypothetical protein